MTISAKETSYAGCQFRSRLEARWAVFLDAMHVEWEYEPEGFVFSDGTSYLPDFYLPKFGIWLEIKGAGKVSEAELKKFGLFASEKWELGERAYMLVGGLPSQHIFSTISHIRLTTDNTLADPGDPSSYPIRGYVVTTPFDNIENKHLVLSDLSVDAWPFPGSVEEVVDALSEARSSRFEHGQSGSIKVNLDKALSKEVSGPSRKSELQNIASLLLDKLGADVLGHRTCIKVVKEFNRDMVLPPLEDSEVVEIVEKAWKSHPKSPLFGWDGLEDFEKAVNSKSSTPRMYPEDIDDPYRYQ